jgi:hypothetical protein
MNPFSPLLLARFRLHRPYESLFSHCLSHDFGFIDSGLRTLVIPQDYLPKKAEDGLHPRLFLADRKGWESSLFSHRHFFHFDTAAWLGEHLIRIQQIPGIEYTANL